jgi:hypothetical protein
MSGYDQIRKAFQDLIAPELHVIRDGMRALDQKSMVSTSIWIEGGARVSAEICRRLACVASRVVMRLDEDGRVVEIGAR